MKRDDIRNLLGEKVSEEDITNLLNTFHTAEKAKNDEIASLKSENAKYSDYDTIKQQLDAINLAKMTEQERLEADKKATAEALKNAKIIYNTAKVKEILAGEVVNDELIAKLVSDSEETSVASANALKATLTALKDDVAKKTKESLVTADLKPSMPNVNPNDEVMTFDKFSKLSAVEQEKFIAEHPEEFEKL